MRLRLVATILLLFGVFLSDQTTLSAYTPLAGRPSHHATRGFQNLSPDYSYSLTGRLGRFMRRGFESSPQRGPGLTLISNDGQELRSNGHKPTVTWVGHSTLLVQLDGVNILTDPHWGDRASPVSFAGPKRLVPPGLRFEDLPPIHAVIISHDHYDHLDETTVRRLAEVHRPTFFVPLGIKAWLADVGVYNAVELDWWESKTFRGLTFTCTPAQHSSGRGLRDQNLRLWSSWVIGGRAHRFFFAGDTGYDTTLAEIGRRLGPFDLAAIPIGGYYSMGRHPNHVNPEEAVALLRDVKGRLLVPMHWGTFDMNREPFREPPDRLVGEAKRQGIQEHIELLSPGQWIHW